MRQVWREYIWAEIRRLGEIRGGRGVDKEICGAALRRGGQGACLYTDPGNERWHPLLPLAGLVYTAVARDSRIQIPA